MTRTPPVLASGSQHPSSINRVPDRINCCAIGRQGWSNVNMSAVRNSPYVEVCFSGELGSLQTNQCAHVDNKCMSGPMHAVHKCKPRKAAHQSAARSCDCADASRSRTPAPPLRSRPMTSTPPVLASGSQHPSIIDRVPDRINCCAIAEQGWSNVNTSAGMTGPYAKICLFGERGFQQGNANTKT